jgi:hypothetical protein
MKSVMSRMAEVTKALELASHKIELGAAEDLAKAKGDMETMIKSLNDELVKYKAADANISKVKVDAQKMIDAANTSADKVAANGEKVRASVEKSLLKFGNMFDKIDKQAKDLGIDPKQIPNYSEVDKLYFAVEDASKALNSYTWENA